MGFSGLWRIIIAVFIAGTMFFFIPGGTLYILIIIPAILIMIASKRRLFVIIAFISIFVTVLVGVMAIIGYAEEMEEGTNFFVLLYSLLMPDGITSSWSQSLPVFFVEVISISFCVLLCLMVFAYLWRRKQYDRWLMEAFSFTLLTVLFIYTIICIFAVVFNLYEAVRLNYVSLLGWELLFVWLPFYALFFMLYYLLGYIFRRL